jgi:type IV secretory pathway VirB10-like protein
VDINYAVLLPPPKRSAKKLQMAILGGVGFVALTAIVVAIVLIKAYAPQAAPLGPQVPTPSVAPMSQPVVAPTPAAPDVKPAPATADKVDDKATKAKKRVGRRGGRGRAAAAKSGDSGSAPAKPKKKADDELKKLLGI